MKHMNAISVATRFADAANFPINQIIGINSKSPDYLVWRINTIDWSTNGLADYEVVFSEYNDDVIVYSVTLVEQNGPEPTHDFPHTIGTL